MLFELPDAVTGVETYKEIKKISLKRYRFKHSSHCPKPEHMRDESHDNRSFGAEQKHAFKT